MDSTDLSNPQFYLNRELSMLEFNRRVLAQANDDTIPILERLKFLCIFSSNLDEFFEIRVAGLKQLVAYGSKQAAPDGLTPSAALKEISRITHNLVVEQYKTLNEQILPALEHDNIRFIPPKEWSSAQVQWITQYFREEILPVVSPVGLDPAHPMPRLVNKSLNFIVSLEGKDAFGRDLQLAIVHAPRALPRVIRFPAELSKTNEDFVLLTSIIETHAGELFPGMRVTGCYQFRLTRNSDLLLDDAIADDLARVLKNKLLLRPYGVAVRLEIANNCPPGLADFLLEKHNLSREELYDADGPVNLSRFIKIYETVDRPALKYPLFIPALPHRLKKNSHLFAAIQKHDLLMHLPYQSFKPALDLIYQATLDPNVIAIKQTLYRTGPDSLIVRALADAARAGKEVTAIIELRARFEEESNIALANRLQEAGVLVVYGVMGFKTHCKMILVVRREGELLRRYCHLSTGNYHSGTARAYTDYGLFTCDDGIGHDVQNLFQQLTGMGKVIKLKKLAHAPFTLAKQLFELITRETEFATAGRPAAIIAKLNAITDPKIIQALYTASQAGVKIDLIVRGICCLRPGISGISDNIRVRSIVGRFLEHERIYWFHNDGDEKIFCSSADWMERNFYKRVEVSFPIEDKELAEIVKQNGLLLDLMDNCQSWELQSDGTYRRNRPGKDKPISAQQVLLEQVTLVKNPIDK